MSGPSKQDQYDAALIEALHLQGERKYDEALLALREAAIILPGDAISGEIERLTARIALRDAAEKAAQDIRIILNEGKGDAAASLATDALKQYGGSDLAGELELLKRQADALVTAPLKEADDRKTRFSDEADTALKDGNYRAAAIALEQALHAGAGTERQKQLDDVRARLKEYDDKRQKAADLRRDPDGYDAAVIALKDAERAWGTLQIKQDIDKMTVLL